MKLGITFGRMDLCCSDGCCCCCKVRAVCSDGKMTIKVPAKFYFPNHGNFTSKDPWQELPDNAHHINYHTIP